MDFAPFAETVSHRQRLRDLHKRRENWLLLHIKISSLGKHQRHKLKERKLQVHDKNIPIREKAAVITRKYSSSY